MSDTLLFSPVSNESIFHFFAKMMVDQDPWKKMGYSFQDCRSSFDGHWRQTYGLFLDDAPIGFVVLQPHGTFRGYIQTLCVAPEYHNRGYGNLLLQNSEQLIAMYSGNVFICVSEFNADARRLYHSRGYKIVGVLNDFVKIGFNEILMRKIL